MKRILAIFAVVTVFFTFSLNCFAKAAPKTVKGSSVAVSKVKDIKFARSSSQDKITIYTSTYKGYKVTYLPSPDRLIIDIPNNVLALSFSKAIKTNGTYIKNIRFSQYTKNSVRIVLDVPAKVKYSIEEKKGILSLIIKKQALTPISSTNRGDVDRIPAKNTSPSPSKPTPTPTPVPTLVPSPIPSPSPAPTSMPTPTPTPSVTDNSQTAGETGSTIPSDVPATAGITFSSRNIEYVNYNGRINFLIKGIALTEGLIDFKSQCTSSYDETGMKYTLVFPSQLVSLDSGILQINDGSIAYIEIANDAVAQSTIITFAGLDKIAYEFLDTKNSNEAVITLLKKYSSTDKLVVLDAGHGGKDSGASYAGVLEKDLNLKITLKVDEILRSKNIKTYLIRKDDTYVAPYDRTYIANDMNASLFLSVHNNAFNSTEYGTETLYYPKDEAKRFARNVQDSLINSLGTKNRGIIERPNLVVLHATKMPAALAEVAFITNTNDRALLLDDGFIQKAAEALSEAVIKTLGEMMQ